MGKLLRAKQWSCKSLRKKAAQHKWYSKYFDKFGKPFPNIQMFLLFALAVSFPEESQPKKQSLASHLSEKFKASLNSDHEKDDDDFQPDRKRIRTAEHKVVVSALLCCFTFIVNLLYIQFKVWTFFNRDERNTNMDL